MNKKITIFEYSIITYFAIRASLTGINSMLIIGFAKQSSWFAIIVGFILGLLPIYLFFKIRKKLNDKTVFQIANPFVNFLLIAGVSLYILVMFYNLTNFVFSQYLNKTPMIFIGLLFMIAMIYTLNKGLNVLARSFVIIFYICIILFLISILGLLPKTNFENLKPFLADGINPVIKGAISYVAYSVLPIIIIGAIPNNKIEKNHLNNKSTLITYIFIAIIAILVSVNLIGVLGVPLAELYQYSEFHILKEINYFNFINRLERTLAIQWILNFYCFCTIGIHFVLTGLESFKIKYNKYSIFIVCLLFTIGQAYLFSNNTSVNSFLRRDMIYILFIWFIPNALYLVLKKDDKNHLNNV